MSDSNIISSSIYNDYLHQNRVLNNTAQNPHNKKSLIYLALLFFLTNITLFLNGSIYSISSLLHNKLSDYDASVIRNLRVSDQEFIQRTISPTHQPIFEPTFVPSIYLTDFPTENKK